MAGASDEHSTAKLLALLGGIASVLSILAWLGVSNAAELKDLLTDAPPASASASPTPNAPPSTVHAPGGSGTGGGSTHTSGAEPSTPAPGPTEKTFKAISAGDCLAVYDTGHGGSANIDWSVDAPPDPVSCAAEQAQVKVTATDTACPTGQDKSYWSHRSATTGDTTKLCLTRIYHYGHCLLGRQTGDAITFGFMTAVDCRRKTVPAPYNQIMHITGVYRRRVAVHHHLPGRLIGNSAPRRTLRAAVLVPDPRAFTRGGGPE